MIALLPSAPWADQGRTVVASGATGWNPYLMRSPDTGRFCGVLHDVLKRAAEKAGVKVEFVELPWKRVLDNVEHGEVDIVCGIYRTEERSLVYEFSSPIVRDEIRVFVAEDFPMDGPSDLVGRAGDRPLGGSYGDEFDSFARRHLAITEISDKTMAFRRLLRGHTEYVVLAYADGMYYLRQEGLTDRIHALPHVIATNDVYFAFSMKSEKAALLRDIFTQVDKLLADGTVQEIFDDYVSGPDLGSAP